MRTPRQNGFGINLNSGRPRHSWDQPRTKLICPPRRATAERSARMAFSLDLARLSAELSSATCFTLQLSRAEIKSAHARAACRRQSNNSTKHAALALMAEPKNFWILIGRKSCHSCRRPMVPFPIDRPANQGTQTCGAEPERQGEGSRDRRHRLRKRVRPDLVGRRRACHRRHYHRDDASLTFSKSRRV